MESQSLLDPLSERELEVLRLLAEDKSNREVGEELFISAETVKWYNKQIYSKLDVSSRSEAVQKAHTLGLLERPTELDISTRQDVNLPVYLTSFIGRYNEIEAIKDLLATNRLITLTGPGGAGKTRLGVQAATACADRYQHGVAFVELALIRDVALVPNAIANALGLREGSQDAPVRSIKQYLSKKSFLLIIDNFEHLLEAAVLITDLLKAAPNVHIIVTSREPLNLHGEQVYDVPPLIIPDLSKDYTAADLASLESIVLFVQRAQATDSLFELTRDNAAVVAQICARLDGLPLAIELAAARIRLLKPEQLLKKLEDRFGLLTGGPRDAPQRQQTIRDTLDWSYNLLTEDEQTLFARCAVFFGGRSIEAVEAVCSTGLSVNIFDGLNALLSKSLLYTISDDPRFGMLETIHQYARECLTKSGEESHLKQRHLAYFLAMVETFAPDLRRRNQLKLLKRLELEMPNILTAWQWAMDDSDVESAARLVIALRDYAWYWSHYVEIYRMTRQVMPYYESLPDPIKPAFLIAIGMLSTEDDIGASIDYFEMAADLSRQMGDNYNLAWAQMNVGFCHTVNAESTMPFEEAIACIQEALVLCEQLDDKPGMAMALTVYGESARYKGEYELAREVYERSHEIVQETGEVLRESMLVANLVFIAYHQQQYSEALAYAHEALEKKVKTGGKSISITALALFSGPLCKVGQPELGARLLGASSALLESLGVVHQVGDAFEFEQFAREVEAALDKETFDKEFDSGRLLSFEQAVKLALSI